MDKRNKRTKRSGIVAVGMAAVLAVGGIFAFMSDHDNAINKFNFTNENGDSSIDIQLSETEWLEENGVDIQYGTPVAKNPVATNIGTNDMYAFATVILPAKGVTVQNKMGQIVDVNNKTLSELLEAKKAEAADPDTVTMDDVLDELGIQRTIANNVSNGDKVTEGDETEILGVFKTDMATEYDFGEALESTVYFKLQTSEKVIKDIKADMNWADDTDNIIDNNDGTYWLKDTIDKDNFTSEALGHQFMLKYEADDSGKIAIRELYSLEINGTSREDGAINTIAKDTSDADAGKYTGRITDDGIVWVEEDDANLTDRAGEKDQVKDMSPDALKVHDQSAVYGRYQYHDADIAGGVTGHWIEITDKLTEPTIYIDGAGRVYSAHVFYYSEPLQSGQSTIPVFDAVELINVVDGQIKEQDDMNIYVETYGIQVSGLGDALGATDPTTADGGKIIWDVVTNATDDASFDIFGVVDDTQDDTVTALSDAKMFAENGYVPVTP